MAGPTTARGALRLLFTAAAFAFVVGLPDSLRVMRSLVSVIAHPL